MPTTFTHDFFGKIVYQKLPEDMQDLIMQHRMAYLIGQHGPDILFYYRPFKENEVNRIGHRMHDEIAAGFFQECKEKYLESGNNTLLVCTLGFICHYMLDSSCHPYIREYMEKTGAGHDEIETELDRTLMEKNGWNPFVHRPASDLKLDKETIHGVAEVFEGITEKQIRKALKSMHFYTGITVCRNVLKRKVLLRCLRVGGIYKQTQGRVIRKKRLQRCTESSRELLTLVRLAVPETVTVLEDFYHTLGDRDYLNYRFERNYK